MTTYTDAPRKPSNFRVDLTGKNVFVTGGARGQGRSHALSFAEAGANVGICDAVRSLPTVDYPLATPDDLAETQRLVEKNDRQCVTFEADVSDTAAIEAAFNGTVEALGGVDIVIANAGIVDARPFWEISDERWDDMIATNLTGVFKTLRVAAPHLVDRGWGRIIVTSSMGGKFGNPNLAHYVASKWGVIGLVKTLALELADKNVTVNAITPNNVSSPMVHNRAMYQLFRPDLDDPQKEDVVDSFQSVNKIPVPWVEVSDVSNAMLYLASDAAWCVTGSTVDVALGVTATMP